MRNLLSHSAVDFFLIDYYFAWFIDFVGILIVNLTFTHKTKKKVKVNQNI